MDDMKPTAYRSLLDQLSAALGRHDIATATRLASEVERAVCRRAAARDHERALVLGEWVEREVAAKK